MKAEERARGERGRGRGRGKEKRGKREGGGGERGGRGKGRGVMLHAITQPRAITQGMTQRGEIYWNLSKGKH